jgi:hypothetical protein
VEKNDDLKRVRIAAHQPRDNMIMPILSKASEETLFVQLLNNYLHAMLSCFIQSKAIVTVP